MRGFGRIKRSFLRSVAHLDRKVVILTYHRVVDLPGCPYPIVVSPDHFAQQMDFVWQNCQPMRLLDVIRAVRDDSLPRRGVVVTFDDGYVDNLTNAYPVLEDAHIPATLFVTSGYAATAREYWWDELELILLSPENVPPELTISFRGRPFTWPTGTIEERQQARHAVYRILRRFTAAERDVIIADLWKWAGRERSSRPDFRTLTTAELITIRKSGLIDLGVHTTTHPVLSTLSFEAQYDEIVGARRWLEGVLGEQVLTFSYPYGGDEYFNEESVQIVTAAGFHAACTMNGGTVRAGSNLFRLPRCWVGDWDRETFVRKLEGFFAGYGY